MRWKYLGLLAAVGCSGGAGASDAGTDRGAPSGDVPVGRVVINEVRATTDDWVELMNVGEGPVDLGGMVLADTDTEGNVPRVEEGVEFPAATWLAPGQHLLVLADVSDAGVGAQMTCLGGDGPMTCHHARFGISAARGEGLFLIGRDHVVTATAVYPADAAPEGSSWGRVPDGTGEFVVNRPTPGVANVGR